MYTKQKLTKDVIAMIWIASLMITNKNEQMKEKIFFSLITIGILAISTIFALLMYNII